MWACKTLLWCVQWACKTPSPPDNHVYPRGPQTHLKFSQNFSWAILMDVCPEQLLKQFNHVIKQGLEENIKLCDTYYSGWQVDWILDNMGFQNMFKCMMFISTNSSQYYSKQSQPKPTKLMKHISAETLPWSHNQRPSIRRSLQVHYSLHTNYYWLKNTLFKYI